jgi:HSP20 family molecular chaperone IbpA
MAFTKKSVLLIGLVGALAIVCVGEGVVIYRHQRGLSPETIADHDITSFSSLLNHRMQADRNDNWRMFDRFFNDDFFSGRKDPFVDMDRLHKQMENMMENGLKDPFNASWDSWYGNRFLGGQSDMNVQTVKKGNDYLVTLTIPNLKDDKLNITVDSHGIAVNGYYSQSAEKKDDKGNIISREDVRRTVTSSVPLPDGADYHNARIDRMPDRLVITLPKMG